MSIIAAPARKSSRRIFGQGLLRTLPTYRVDCTIADQAWWEQENAMEEERELTRRFGEYLAMDRLSNGLDC